MLHWIISSSLRLRNVMLALAVLLLVGGVWRMQSLPVDIVPEFSRPALEVQTEALGLSTAEVESLITVPLEADLLNGVPWLESIESESITSLSSIEMYFAPGTDMSKARQLVQERLTQAHALPQVSSPPTLLQPVSSASRIMNIGLSGTLTAGGKKRGLILDVGGYYKNVFTLAPSLYITEDTKGKIWRVMYKK